jgi:hypothetical protein
MKFRTIAILAMIGLLISVATVPALGSVSLYKVNWNPMSHTRGVPGQYILVYFTNDDYRAQSVLATLQLSIPGWYTRSFQSQLTIPGNRPSGNADVEQINFILDKSWPVGNYKATVLVPNAVTSQMSGTISVN